MATFQVRILDSAEQDLKQIIRWVAKNDSPAKAKNLLDKLVESYLSLEELPLRGHHLPELTKIGISDYLEIHQGPYRLIYQVTQKTVFIHAVLDGRRDMEDLLSQRLLG
ncbi:MAG: type II toxin-antitoxin system RelE/ParE family toxin [SAR324 cluster bacterium]|nr:type II toxin-antitoxin system RelE/ParE family toxin [SAR324 cluster bacterium]